MREGRLLPWPETARAPRALRRLILRCLAFDPERVCNPGKLIPTTRFCAEANPKARGYDRVPFE